MQIRVNFISTDKSLIERIKIYFRDRQDIRLFYSDHPLAIENTELYISPIRFIEQLSSHIQQKIEKLLIIFYGNPGFLRKAFLAGCEDYLKDPWTVEELALRVSKAVKKVKPIYTFPWGNISITGTVVESEMGRCDFSIQEYKIFKTLIQNRGSAVPREVLFYQLWNHPGPQDSRIIDVHISSIRKKLQGIIAKDYYDNVIISVRSIGYMIK